MCRTFKSVRRSRKGLTLIELIVVLMILVALAGVLIPMLPSMLTCAHTSTMTTNTGETAKAILTYQQLYQAYPNNFDSLGDGSTTIDYQAGGAAEPPGTFSGAVNGQPGNGELQPLTLTTAEANALAGVGITQVQRMVTAAKSAPAGFDPTFNYYSDPTPAAGAITIGQGTVLLGLDPTAAGANSTTYSRCLTDNLPLTGRYVALGIGPRCSMVGKTIQSAPVFFGDQPVINVENCYGRYVAIFKVSDTAVGGAFTQNPVRRDRAHPRYGFG